MRLLIYLLAMLSGFSAAEASRPMTVAPATLGSAISPATIVAASVVLVQLGDKSYPEFNNVNLAASARLVPHVCFAEQPRAVPTPVLNHDVSHQ